ncbi:MAG: class I SAM-dependent methyltransferase [Tepidisphaeraceae bacterium]
MPKSTPDDIRRRFDADVERFSNLETGQSATMDAPLAMDLVARAAALATPNATHVLDVGCGAGNYTLKLMQHKPNLDATLVDLSRPMLDRAVQRVSAATAGKVTALQGDIREIELAGESVDIILAAAVLHHLRTDDEWRIVFAKFHRALRPGGGVWIFDLIDHTIPAAQAIGRQQHSDYLVAFKGEAYRDHVFAYIEEEDTPKPLVYQLELLRSVGFAQVDVLHKVSCFAAFGAVKS